MSIVEKYMCDQCKEEVSDRFDAVGWVTLNIKDISISMGRTKQGSARTAFLGHLQTLDFCSIDCLVRFLDDMAEKRQKELDNQRIGEIT